VYQRAAKSSAIEVDGSKLAFANWQASISAIDLDTTNFQSYDATNGMSYEEGILGVIGCAGNFGGDWDAHDNPIDFTGLVTPPGLYPRDDLPDVFFYTSVVDNVFFEFPYMRIRESQTGAQIKALVTFSCSYKNQGIFDFPTGSAA